MTEILYVGISGAGGGGLFQAFGSTKKSFCIFFPFGMGKKLSNNVLASSNTTTHSIIYSNYLEDSQKKKFIWRK